LIRVVDILSGTNKLETIYGKWQRNDSKLLEYSVDTDSTISTIISLDIQYIQSA